MDLFCRDAGRARSRFSLTEFFLKCLLAFYIAIAPAYAFSASELSFLRLDTVKTVAGGLIADYKYSAIGGALLVAKDVNVSNTVMGQIWRNRWKLAKGGVVGIAGQLAVELALKAAGWILDPANNRIYMPDAPNYKYCLNNYVQPGLCYDTVNQFVEGRFAFASSGGKIINIEQPRYSESEMRAALKGKPVGSYKQNSAVFNYYHTSPYNNDTKHQSTALPYAVVIGTTDKEATNDDIAEAVELAEQSSPGTKEALATPTPEEDANGDHQPNEDAKKKAAPDTPADCPTGQVKDSTGKCVPKETASTGGGTAFKLPEFCDWAKTLCDFVDWIKKEPELKETPPIKPKDIKPSDIPQGRTINFAGGCPADRSFTISLGITSRTIPIPYKYACDFMIKINPFVNAGGYLVAAWIVVSNVRS